VAVFGVTILGERLSASNWLGIVLIAGGSILVAHRGRTSQSPCQSAERPPRPRRNSISRSSAVSDFLSATAARPITIASRQTRVTPCSAACSASPRGTGTSNCARSANSFASQSVIRTIGSCSRSARRRRRRLRDRRDHTRGRAARPRHANRAVDPASEDRPRRQPDRRPDPASGSQICRRPGVCGPTTKRQSRGPIGSTCNGSSDLRPDTIGGGPGEITHIHFVDEVIE
jgi:hypothetical protein